MKKIYKAPTLRMVELEESANLCADSSILSIMLGGTGTSGDKAEVKRHNRWSDWDDDFEDDDY